MGLAGTLALLAATVAAVFGVALSTDEGASSPVGDAGAPADGAEPAAKLDSDELLKLGL